MSQRDSTGSWVGALVIVDESINKRLIELSIEEKNEWIVDWMSKATIIIKLFNEKLEFVALKPLNYFDIFMALNE